jgi:hypothetical protein
MKFSEFYKLIDSAGWTIEKGKKHHKYVHPAFFIMLSRVPLGISLAGCLPTGIK